MRPDEAYEKIRRGVSDDQLREILDELWNDARDEGASIAHFDI